LDGLVIVGMVLASREEGIGRRFQSVRFLSRVGLGRLLGGGFTIRVLGEHKDGSEAQSSDGSQLAFGCDFEGSPREGVSEPRTVQVDVHSDPQVFRPDRDGPGGDRVGVIACYDTQVKLPLFRCFPFYVVAR
jgi:hypothetical protein